MKEKYLSFDEKPYLNTVIEKYKKKNTVGVVFNLT
jgi:hypothetical protein